MSVPVVFLDSLKGRSRPSWDSLFNAYPKTQGMAEWYLRYFEGWFGLDNFTDRDELVDRFLTPGGRRDAEKEFHLPEGALENTCALRFTAMLNQVKGHQITNHIKVRATKRSKERIITYKSKKNGLFYLISSVDLCSYLEKVYGDPHVLGLSSREKTDDIPIKLKNKKGFIVFWGLEAYGYPGGHADLWDGEICVGNQKNYFKAKEFRFWEVK